MRALMFMGLFAAVSAHFVYNEFSSSSFDEEVGPRKLMCYYDKTSTQNGYFNTTNLKSSLCTHLIYAYVGVNHDATIKIDQQVDIEKGGFKKVVRLGQYDNVYMKILLGVRDDSEKRDAFSAVLSSGKRRALFISNLFNLVKRHNFEGVEINWAKPAKYGAIANEKIYFAMLLKALYIQFIPAGYLVTVALNPHPSFLETSYSIPYLNKYTNFIVLRTNDYLDGWHCLTSFQAPIYNTHQYVDDHVLNINGTVQHWLNSGVNSDKLVLTIPLNGVTFTLRDATKNGADQQVTGPGITLGTSSQKTGMLYYKEICAMVKAGGWTEVFEPQAKVYYAYNGDQWMSYETRVSVRNKAMFIKNNFLAGSAVWAVHMDDFQDSCGNGKYPLINIIRKTQR